MAIIKMSLFQSGNLKSIPSLSIINLLVYDKGKN